MKVFSDIGESSVFKNEEVLLTQYLPEMMPHRDGEIKQIARNLMPLAKGRKSQNTFLFGPPGIGKTSVVKYVFREFEEYSEHVKCVYINCWDHRTPTALLTQLIIELGVFVQRRGWSRDEIMAKLTEVLNKGAKGIALCLDEVDQLDMSALYDLLRINQYAKTPVGIVFISNNPHVFAKAEPRIRSSLGTDNIEFKSYNINEMKNILIERASNTFHSFDPAIVMLCANHAVQKGGDVRVGLQCLLKAGRMTEQKNAKKVRVEHVKPVLKDIDEVKPEILKEKINKHESIVLEVLKDGKKLSSGELYEKYKKLADVPVSDRALRDFVNHLHEINLIEISEKKVGKSRMIWLKYL